MTGKEILPAQIPTGIITLWLQNDVAIATSLMYNYVKWNMSYMIAKCAWEFSSHDRNLGRLKPYSTLCSTWWKQLSLPGTEQKKRKNSCSRSSSSDTPSETREPAFCPVQHRMVMILGTESLSTGVWVMCWCSQIALQEKVAQDNWVRMFFSPPLVHTLPQLNVGVSHPPLRAPDLERVMAGQNRAGRFPTWNTSTGFWHISFKGSVRLLRRRCLLSTGGLW